RRTWLLQWPRLQKELCLCASLTSSLAPVRLTAVGVFMPGTHTSSPHDRRFARCQSPQCRARHQQTGREVGESPDGWPAAAMAGGERWSPWCPQTARCRTRWKLRCRTRRPRSCPPGREPFAGRVLGGHGDAIQRGRRVNLLLASATEVLVGPVVARCGVEPGAGT